MSRFSEVLEKLEKICVLPLKNWSRAECVISNQLIMKLRRYTCYKLNFLLKWHIFLNSSLICTWQSALKHHELVVFIEVKGLRFKAGEDIGEHKYWKMELYSDKLGGSFYFFLFPHFVL